MRLLVVGAGGHAKVVADAAQAAGMQIAGVVGTAGGATTLLGHPVVHSADAITADGFIVAIGDNRTRARYFEEYLEAGLEPVSVIHPSVIVGSDVGIGGGTFIAAGVVVNTGARIGRDVILNTGCAVDHDVALADHVHVGPRVALCGGVRIGEGVLLGVGSCVVPLGSVGEWSIIGAGAAVTGDLTARRVYVGVPARSVHGAEERDG